MEDEGENIEKKRGCLRFGVCRIGKIERWWLQKKGRRRENIEKEEEWKGRGRGMNVVAVGDGERW